MGWMKRIYTMCQEGTLNIEFTKPYHQALANEDSTMMFQGVKITIKQAAGIEALANDAKKTFANG